MRRILSTVLTALGLFGLITPDTIASVKVLKHLDNYANYREIPQVVKDKIIKEDLSKKESSRCGGKDGDNCAIV